MKYLLIIVSVFICSIGFSQEQERFQEANTLYKEAKYSDALNVYNSLVSKGVSSPELYFNLGNTHYKLNNTAQSIYNFEKALQLNPKDETIKQNLAFANNMRIDAIEVLPEIGYTKYFNKFSSVLSTHYWAILSIIFSVLFVVVVLFYYFSNRANYKRLYFILSGAFIILCLFSLSIAQYKSNNIDNKRYAIVFAKESKVKTESNFKSEDAFLLHEGTKVLVTSMTENWLNIKLTDGKTGWILKKDLKFLNKI